MALISSARWRLFIVCLTAMTVSDVRRTAGEPPGLEHRWKGRIDWVARYTTPHGEFRHTFGFDVSWKERRVDVTSQGRTVGQVVILEDDGTRWSGVVDGKVESDVMTTTASGHGSGTGQPVQAWIYRSGAADDPVRALDGAYGFASSPGASFSGTMTIVNRLTGTSTQPMPSAAQFHAGGSVMYPRGTAPITADALRALVEQGRTLAQQVAAVDRAPRTLLDGAMTGAYTYTHPPGGLIVTMSWNLHRRLNIKGTLTEAPEGWRPLAVGGESAALTASLDPSLGMKGRFRFTLFGVSREPGYAMNKGTGTGLDLKFSDAQPAGFRPPKETSDGFTIETSDLAAAATVQVAARDYGGWGRLKAEVEVDGEWYDCAAPSGGASVLVPFDRNENHIADVWERELGLSRVEAAADVDSGVNAEVGDGFSNYEEYRGFVVSGTWTATDPTMKELFIVDEAGVGTGDFAAASTIVPLIIRSDEWDNGSRTVNLNRHYATAGAQRGLRLKNKRLAPGTLGEVTPRVGTPNQVEEVRIDLVQLAAIPGSLDSTIAHEIGHAVGIEHHGTYEVSSCGDRRGRKLIALWHGAHGGDRSCIMSYSGANSYKRSDRVCHDYVWPNVFGHALCRSAAGTDINGGDERVDEAGHPMPVSGAAQRGNCVAQVRLK